MSIIASTRRSTRCIGDLKSKKIEAAIVWGPLIGSDVKASDGALDMVPLLKDVDKPGFSYRITLGIRHDEPDWKHKLEGGAPQTEGRHQPGAGRV